MERKSSTPAAENKTANNTKANAKANRGSYSKNPDGTVTKEEHVEAPVNPLQRAVLAQNSKKAQAILKEAEGKAKEEKKDKGSKPASKPASKKTDAKAPKKEKKVTIASKLDEIIKAGGEWEALVKAAQKASNDLGGTLQFSIGTLKAHIKFRTVTQAEKNPDYLGNKKVTDKGVLEPVKKAKKVA